MLDTTARPESRDGILASDDPNDCGDRMCSSCGAVEHGRAPEIDWRCLFCDAGGEP